MNPRRLCTIVLGTCLVMLLAPVPGYANPVPDPETCSVMPPDTFQYQRIVGFPTFNGNRIVVTVLDSSGQPMPNVYVELVFDPACSRLCVCVSAVLEGYTNANGQVELRLATGGCCQQPGAATILAQGIPIRIYNTVTSPDLTGPVGAGDCRVVLADFSVIASCLGTGAGGCCDFTGDDASSLVDLVVFGGVWGGFCTLGSGR
jgi:hypothetical protein